MVICCHEDIIRRVDYFPTYRLQDIYWSYSINSIHEVDGKSINIPSGSIKLKNIIKLYYG